MIPKAYIDGWRKNAPWPQSAQVEQDLVICRALIEIFSRPFLAEGLAFRGGTALFKLHMPPVRYSEDIDLVQVEAGPIGPLLDDLRKCLDPWLGEPGRKRNQGRVTLTYRFKSEDDVPLKLKVEINTREHFAIHGFQKYPFIVESRWFSGEVRILTYDLEELLGTKLRALYQRKKGRDLFDLWYALTHIDPTPDLQGMVDTFLQYMEHGEFHISRAQFEQNLFEKRENPQFVGDIGPLLTSDSVWAFEEAFEFIMAELISLLPGDPWQGRKA